MVRHVLREPPTGPTIRKEELLVSILWIIIIVIIVLLVLGFFGRGRYRR